MRLRNPIQKQDGTTGVIVGARGTAQGEVVFIETADGTIVRVELDPTAINELRAQVEERGITLPLTGKTVTVYGEESGIWFEFH